MAHAQTGSPGPQTGRAPIKPSLTSSPFKHYAASHSGSMKLKAKVKQNIKRSSVHPSSRTFYSFSLVLRKSKCVNSLSLCCRAVEGGLGLSINRSCARPAQPPDHWSLPESPALAPDTAANSDSSRQASESLFSFSVFFLFLSLSVLYHTRCIWFARCLYGDYPLSLYRCYWCFISTTIAPVMFKIIRDI